MSLTQIQGAMVATAHTVAAFNEINRVMGGGLVISSPYGAHRTRAQQGILYDLYRSGRGSPAAPAGSSNHEGGVALDIWNWAAFPKLRSVMAAHGFTRDPNEQWHYNNSGAWVVPASTSITTLEDKDEDMKVYFNVKTKELAVGGAGVWSVVPSAPVPGGNGLAIVRSAFGAETAMQDADYNYVRSICQSGASSSSQAIDLPALAALIAPLVKSQTLTITGTATPKA
jgi:hypothetical protein